MSVLSAVHQYAAVHGLNGDALPLHGLGVGGSEHRERAQGNTTLKHKGDQIKLNRIELAPGKCKFTLKDMLYRGNLEL